MSDLVEGPWCTLDDSIRAGSPDWCFDIGYYRLFACDDFWQYFDWNHPKRGEEMRLVFSSKRVTGAQKTLVRGEVNARYFIVGEGKRLGAYSALDGLLTELQPEEVPEFYVWWWPEYRAGAK